MNVSLNVGGWDRIARLVLGVVLIASAYFGGMSAAWAILAYIVGGIALITGIVQFCPANALLGINTRKPKTPQTPD